MQTAMTIQLLIAPGASLPAAVLEAIVRKARAAGLSPGEYVARLLIREAADETPGRKPDDFPPPLPGE